MQFVFLGPPGVGKGTQAAKVSEKHGVVHIATGDILRKAMAEKSPLGVKAKGYIDEGKLVPDALIIELMNDRVRQPDAKSGYILDGFPRTMGQGQAFTEALEQNGEHLDGVIYFSLDDAALVERISGRRSCPSCQSVYHMIFNRPKNDEICACGTPLIRRKDDDPETVTKRLSVYGDQTAPLIAYYKELGLLSEVDAGGDLEGVNGKVEEVLQGCSR